jgi:hypothetical protein
MTHSDAGPFGFSLTCRLNFPVTFPVMDIKGWVFTKPT